MCEGVFTLGSLRGYVWMCVCVYAYNIVQVNVGSSPNELLYYLQTAQLCRHHEGSLPVLEQGEREVTETVIQFLHTGQLIRLFSL